MGAAEVPVAAAAAAASASVRGAVPFIEAMAQSIFNYTKVLTRCAHAFFVSI